MGFTTNADGTVTDERTGLIFANASIGAALGYGQTPNPVAVAQAARQIPVSASSPGGIDYRDRDMYGNLITNQIGSQYWMNAANVLTNQNSELDPSLADKAKASDAEYAYQSLVAYQKTGVFVDPMSPTGFSGYVRAPVITSPQASPNGGGTAVAPIAATPDSKYTTETPASAAADPDTKTGGLTSIGGFINTLSNYSAYVLLGVVIVVGLFVVLARGKGTGAS
jgi:hypothetical protein